MLRLLLIIAFFCLCFSAVYKLLLRSAWFHAQLDDDAEQAAAQATGAIRASWSTSAAMMKQAGDRLSRTTRAASQLSQDVQ